MTRRHDDTIDYAANASDARAELDKAMASFDAVLFDTEQGKTPATSVADAADRLTKATEAYLLADAKAIADRIAQIGVTRQRARKLTAMQSLAREAAVALALSAIAFAVLYLLA